MKLNKYLLGGLVVFASVIGLRAQNSSPSSNFQNYQLCLSGNYGCNSGQLTPSEQATVANAAHKRNYNACLYGFYNCDPRQLTASEQPAVAEAAHKRNYYDCLNGRYGCNAGGLTATEQAAVAEAAHKRNYYDCLNGRYGCNAGGLTATEQATVTSPRQDGSAAGVVNTPGQNTLAPVTPPCAENGSCYGDPNANGVPKTVHVDGYYRKDGTYVRGYYRSSPGTNPPRAHR